MIFEAINTSSASVPIGFLFIAAEECGGDENSYLTKCLEKNNFSVPVGERIEVTLSEMLITIKLISKYLINSKLGKQAYFNCTKYCECNRAITRSRVSGRFFLIRCLNCVFYINWYRES